MQYQFAKTAMRMRQAPPAAEAYGVRLRAALIGQVRWGGLAALLLIALLQPSPLPGGAPAWALILGFGAYNLLLEPLRPHLSRIGSFPPVAVMDLLVAALLFLMSATPGGPVALLFPLITICAVAALPFRAGLRYTALVVAVVALITPALTGWSPATETLAALALQAIVIGLVGTGVALLLRHLINEYAAVASIRDQAEQLAELDRLRTDFIATTSHNLRTPLTAARAGLGMLETSASERLRPDEHRLLQNARRNIARLDRHISDLLALNQIEAGALHLDCASLDLRAIVVDALSAVYPLMQEKGQTLELDLPTPLLMEGDRWRLEQVVVNLLSNAHEHTPAGARVQVTGQAEGRTIRLTVADNGPGIPPADRAAIFERFHRCSTSAGGSGLGLAIVKGIVELHEGRIQVASAAGTGAVFQIILPGATRKMEQTNETADCR